MSLNLNLLVVLSVSAFSLTSLAQTKNVKVAKLEPNCEVHGKKSHVKNKAACDKTSGKWLEVDAMKAVPSKVQTPASGSTTTPPVDQAGAVPVLPSPAPTK